MWVMYRSGEVVPRGKASQAALGRGQGLDGQRGGGRGILPESVEGGMSGCSESTSLSAISVCCGFARERADRKAAEAGVAYWLHLGLN